MTNATHNNMNGGAKVRQAQAALAELMAAVSRRGFYGNASITLSLQDGHIQHVKLATEKVLKQ